MNSRLHKMFGTDPFKRCQSFDRLFIFSQGKTITFALLSFLLTGCGRSDATIQKELAGTWTRHFGNGGSITNVIALDGSYHCQLVYGSNEPAKTMEGTLIVKNGVLIDAVTKDIEPNLGAPRVAQEQIFHIDRHQLVLSINNGTAKMTFDKVER